MNWISTYRHRLQHLMIGLVLVLLAAGCSGGAVVFMPTPLPPEQTPTRYVHPSGAFSLVLPPNWSAYTQNLTNMASASFAPPQSRTPLITVAVINLGQPIEASLLSDLRAQYQTQIRPDLQRYTEQDAEALPDGSWRMVGVRRSPTGETQPVNTFIDRRDTLLSVTEVLMPTDPARQTDLQTILNTISLGDAPDLEIAPLTALATVASSGLEIINVHTWTTPQGVFFITGEVTNNSPYAAYDIPVRAVLTRADDNPIAEARDEVMGYGLLPGGFAPFSLRFGQGQPPEATDFSLSLGTDSQSPGDSTDALQRAIITEPDLSWTDAIEPSGNNAYFVIGLVRNESEAPVRQPRVVVTLFDELGRVIAAGFTDADADILPPDESAEFRLLVPDLGGQPANYIVNVQALACDDSC